ncbi:MAG: ribosome biogenesis factor YjgA [Pseudomonadales bacterium]
MAEEYSEDDGKKSKSQLKREMTALQDLGETLVKLSDRDLERVPVDENLKTEILKARSIRQREGRRRQLQYIGKLMRSIDCTPIEAALQQMAAGNRAEARQFHALEDLRDQLIANTDGALENTLQTYPNADRQHLRQLIRNAGYEQTSGKPPASARKLFRYLRELALGD